MRLLGIVLPGLLGGALGYSESSGEAGEAVGRDEGESNDGAAAVSRRHPSVDESTIQTCANQAGGGEHEELAANAMIILRASGAGGDARVPFGVPVLPANPGFSA